MKIKPLNDRVLVVRVEEEQKTAGGIIIPDTAKEKPQEGKIIAAGPGKIDDSGKRTPLNVKKGDKILFSKYAGTEIKIDGVEHISVDDGSVSFLVNDSNIVLPKLFEAARESDIRITSVDIQEPNLETVFLHLTGRELRD